MKNLIQKYFMAIVAVMMIAGFSAFKVGENNNVDDPHLYRLDSFGNIGMSLDEADADCNQPQGDYCYVELKDEKPSHITTVEQALDNDLVEEIFFWD